MKISLLVALGSVLMFFVIGGCAQQSAESIRPTEPTHSIDLSSADRFPTKLQCNAIVYWRPYLPGEEITIELEVRNNNRFPVAVSPFPPEINILMPTLEDHKKVRSFNIGVEGTVLDIGEEHTFELIWDQTDENGEQVETGRYYVVEVSYRVGTREFSDELNSMLIQFPQGAMNKTLHPNKFQTVEDSQYTWLGEKLSTDVTMSLDYVRLCSQGSTMMVTATSSNYMRERGPFVPLYGYYTVDNVVRPLWRGIYGLVKNGVRQTWGDYLYMDPIPSDAKELTITITNWGDWEGPWEFHVPLE